MTARDIGKTAPRGREAPLLDLALVSNSGISLPYPRYIRKATALACPSQVRATSPVKRPRLWDSGVRAPVALICQYIDRHKERFGAWPICRVLSDSGTKIAPATALHHTTGHYPPGRSRDHPRSRGVYVSAAAVEEVAAGSSPFARGLPAAVSAGAGAPGIIPVRAGFTRCRIGRRWGARDDPRSRGVYLLTKGDFDGNLGSSPLARGLLDRLVTALRYVRIIPARAGFTTARAPGSPDASDHPRSRGVYTLKAAPETTIIGSSPLARGLRPGTGQVPDGARLIPARAGFTAPPSEPPSPEPDHPRSRGVYGNLARVLCASSGSSPLARGLLGFDREAAARAGIIPARAGFTPQNRSARPKFQDHPRSRGVYEIAAQVKLEDLGSSPLARGLPGGRRQERVANRIIPARAGFTFTSPSRSGALTDHPRSRGVYPTREQSGRTSRGSSPLARGLPTPNGSCSRSSRIIPARAGFTRRRSRRHRAHPDHPRSRGVYRTSTASPRPPGGSSPLARGLHTPRRRGPGGGGIIPARAGFTATTSTSPPPQRDHPRSRGVYPGPAHRWLRRGGSSPLARGLPLRMALIWGSFRIIPARAGFTILIVELRR